MSDVIAAAVEALQGKLGSGIDGVVKFDLRGLGAIMVDSEGVRAADEDADVTLSADADVFEEILSGDLDPTSAFMTGRLAVEGDMGMAMKLASMLG